MLINILFLCLFLSLRTSKYTYAYMIVRSLIYQIYIISIIYIFLYLYLCARFGKRKTENTVVTFYLMKVGNVAIYSMKVVNGNNKDKNRIK